MAQSSSKNSTKLRRVDSREIARAMLLRLLEPLSGFVLDSGLSVSELTAIFREAAVRSVAAQQLEVSGRLNISRIAASTGISRTEISRILKSTSRYSDLDLSHRQQSTQKVLTAWHQNPKFTNPNGQPADLKIYGQGATFEKLAKTFGGGIPPRAILDELTRTGAVEVNSSQIVQLKSLMTVERGMTPNVIKAFGERTTELLTTLLHNMRNPDGAIFVANASGTKIPLDTMPLVRKELSVRGANFLAEIEDVLVTLPPARRSTRATQGNTVGVTIFLNETIVTTTKNKSQASNKRKNFRRNAVRNF